MSWQDETMSEIIAMDADEVAIRSILSRTFSNGRRNMWSPSQLASHIENKREKINRLFDKYKDQALNGREVIT